jgi:hypothetical protein
LNATVQGSFQVAITSDLGSPIAASGTDAVSVTLPVTGSMRFVLRATQANLAGKRFNLKVKINSNKKGWALDGLDISGGDEHSIATAARFDLDDPHNLLFPNGLTEPTSVTLKVEISN